MGRTPSWGPGLRYGYLATGSVELRQAPGSGFGRRLTAGCASPSRTSRPFPILASAHDDRCRSPLSNDAMGGPPLEGTQTGFSRVDRSATAGLEEYLSPAGQPAHHVRLTPFARYAIRRAMLLPAQLLLLLFLLYMIVYEPYYLTYHQNLGPAGLFTGFSQMLGNDFTGNWGLSYFPQFVYVSLFQLYSWALPGTVELGIIALGISAAIAYPVAVRVGWIRRTGVDMGVHFTGQVFALLPAMLVSAAVIFALFFWWSHTFSGDIPDAGIIPTAPWWYIHYDGYPSWIVYNTFTRPTGMPLVDGALHGAWPFEEIVLVKTLLQAGIIAAIYVIIFLRHAQTVVVASSQEAYVVAARARGVSEGTLRRHTARRVRPTFLLTLAMTFPAYLGTQFVVEAAFSDLGLGNLALFTLTGQYLSPAFLPFGSPPQYGVFLELQSLEVLALLLGIFVLVWLLVVDLLAKRLDPRSVPKL